MTSNYQSDADREGNFYGLVVMPSTYLIDDKLEFVARYVYQASEERRGNPCQQPLFRTPELTLGSDRMATWRFLPQHLCRPQLLPLRQQLQGSSGC